MNGGTSSAQPGIEVIATAISGSIKDWAKVERIVPLFEQHGRGDVSLHVADSHAETRRLARELVTHGSRTIISAGGSGTFNHVIEGCIDSGIGLGELTLGFLRKGSADLIGKTLGMPDEIEEAIKVFVESIAAGCTVRCDVIEVTTDSEDEPSRHFAGYAGAGIFGRIPRYTENRFVKYYKGVLGQLFGDMGPFFVGATLSAIEKSFKEMVRVRSSWRITVDGRQADHGLYHAMIIVNGYLGTDLPFAKGVMLGSGDFHMFALRDLGIGRLPGQFKHAWDASIMDAPDRWGLEPHRIQSELVIAPDDQRPFPVNVDGSTMLCRGAARFRIVDQLRLISRLPPTSRSMG